MPIPMNPASPFSEKEPIEHSKHSKHSAHRDSEGKPTFESIGSVTITKQLTSKPMNRNIATCKAELEQLDQDLIGCDGIAYEAVRKQRTSLIIKIMQLERRELKRMRDRAAKAKEENSDEE